MTVRPWGRRLGLGLGGAALIFVGSAAWAPLPARLAAPPSTVVTWRDGATAHVFLAPDDRWRMAVTGDDVDPDYLNALVALEDGRFWWHPGVDPIAVVRAAFGNLRAGRVESGASTLTMQLVRMLEPRPRTLTSKLVEVWRAVGMEVRLSKAEILAAYLSFTPYGRNLEGVEAASQAAFGHSARDLSPDEIATLLAIPQSPNRRYPRPDHAAALGAARHAIAARLAPSGVLAPGTPAGTILTAVDAAPVPLQLRPMPRDIPHAATWLRDHHPERSRLHTTLDPAAQHAAERILARGAPDREAAGVRHGVVLIADRDGTLRGLVGNTGFLDAGPGAQIAAFDVPRSPGSTLKPLIYALALDRGLALPDRRVEDVPVAWPGYAPENYDGSYSGLVRLEDALSRSLNVPFVDLLADLGVDRFLGVLQQAGVRSLDPTPGHYGLSAAIGGLEITPLELLGLYTALAGDGGARSLRVLREEPLAEPLRIVTPGAAWLTRRALRLRDRPDFPLRATLAELPPNIAWKTGTSFGHRDAWAVGFDDTHLALVWLGNLDQTPSRWLVGADAAGGVLFDALAAVAPRGRIAADDPAPDDLTPVHLCASSGHLPAAACPLQRTALAPKASIASQPCPYHVQVEVETTTGLAVHPGCRGDLETETRAFVQWPPAVRRWLRDRDDRLPERPAWAAGCAPTSLAPPRIVQPTATQVVVLRASLPADRQQIPLEADVGTPDGDIAWFVDGGWITTVPAEERAWWTPSLGVHRVVAVDGSGRSSSVQLRVESTR